MILKEKERTVIEDLQTQEKSCIEKYGKYAQQAKDPELRTLFQNLQQKEREHYDSLSMVLSGNVPECDCNDTSGRDYQPKNTMPFWQLTALAPKNWYQERTTTNCLPLVTVACANFWRISRSKNRTMQKCFINIKQ